MLSILRMDHLSPTVLLCIFDGVPAEVELSEPQEGFGFGVDEDGNAVLRNLVPPSGAKTTPIGAAIGQQPFLVRDMTGANNAYMRVPVDWYCISRPTTPTDLSKASPPRLPLQGHHR